MNTGHLHPFAKKIIRQQAHIKSVAEWSKQIKSGDTASLAQGITLIESNKNQDRLKAIQLLQTCLPSTKKTIRIGITGPPGVGKSSFIESFGNLLLKETEGKIAVLSIDPSSPLQGGSILGDKTRMQTLAVQDRVFIRPTPSGPDPGGIHLRTRESIQLCEYAGFEYILVETVGVGQSDFSIYDVTDMTLLLIPPGGGDTLQGIKRGVTELADIMIINKDDSGMEALARTTQAQYQQAMHLLPDKSIKVLRCSSTQGKGIFEIYQLLNQCIELKKKSKAWAKKRNFQIKKAFENKVRTAWMQELIALQKMKTLQGIQSQVIIHANRLDELTHQYIKAMKKLIMVKS